MKELKKIATKDGVWKINKRVDSNTWRKKHNIYLLECDKTNWKEKYIGETERYFKERVKEHIGYTRTNKLNQSSGYHFNLLGHSIHNMKFTIVEKVKSSDSIYRREKYFIDTFDTFRNGMNKKP